MRVKDQLKIEIDHLDENYLDLLYNIICQFPHTQKPKQKEIPSKNISQLFQDIADDGGLGIIDPIEWQRQNRKDRDLPFRER